MLEDFVVANREEILARARRRVSQRNAPVATEVELVHGLPVFLDQLCDALRTQALHEPVENAELKATAGRHGEELYHQGLTVGQVVHDYGDLCQVITGYALEKSATFPVEEFRTLNLCLDDAIAGAVTGFGERRERAISDEGVERLGVLAHEMRNLLNTAMLSFESIKRGLVAPGGSTSAMHERSLVRIQHLIDRALADVRLEAGMQNIERIPVQEIFEEVEIGALLVAKARGLQLSVTPVDIDVIVSADRQILAAALANLLQNALKFTHTASTVKLRAVTTAERVLIEVEDECGGLTPDSASNLLRPFVQKSADRTGLGLGLGICVKAAKAMSGELRLRDLPGRGCVFTLDLPKQPPPPTSILAHKKTKDEKSPPGGQTARSCV